MFIQLFWGMLNKLGIIILAAFFLTKTEFFKSYVIKKRLTIYDQIIFAFIFGLVGIIGTYWGVPINGAIANSRSIGVILAGFLGGPAVGIGAGIIAGTHRMFFGIGEFTAVACGLSTILGGIIAGYSKKFLEERKNQWFWGGLIAFLIEVLQMAIIILLARPFSDAFALVKLIFIPMTFINAFGVAGFLILIEQILDEHEKAGAVKAQLALRIASKTLSYFRKGLTTYSTENVAHIIFSETSVDAVAFTDRNTILAHVGVGSDHHVQGEVIFTQITKQVIREGVYKIAQNKGSIDCGHPKCKLKSVIVVPLKINDEVIGTLKLYKKHENDVKHSDIELAKGLGQLFSTQLEISELNYQKELRNKAEIKALQAQIHPHFLFNTLNTIVSFCRTNPLKARQLLLELSFYLRHNFKNNEDLITLEKELKHVASYLKIEQARFGERLNVIFNIEEEVTCKVPPLILQPLVENAIKHGIMKKAEGGTIVVTASYSFDHVIVIIEDDGVGMSKDTLEHLLEEAEGKGQGIGVLNVHKRLLSIYGTPLSIESEEGVGTTIILEIPIKEGRNDQIGFN